MQSAILGDHLLNCPLGDAQIMRCDLRHSASLDVGAHRVLELAAAALLAGVVGHAAFLFATTLTTVCVVFAFTHAVRSHDLCGSSSWCF